MNMKLAEKKKVVKETLKTFITDLGLGNNTPVLLNSSTLPLTSKGIYTVSLNCSMIMI